MTATRDLIKSWLEIGIAEGYTHLIVICDEYDHEDYPCYVSKDQDIRKELAIEIKKPLQRIMEVYNLGLDIEPQLKEVRAYNL